MGDECPSSVAAAEVVAGGESPQCMQFPSPVYFARWIDERHAIIGAGGGGKRFGMVNLLAIVALNTMPTPPRRMCALGGNQTVKQPRLEDLPPLHHWCFVTALNMEGNIPWCASSFLPCTDETQLASGVLGHLAVSHISCFTLFEIWRCSSTRGIAIRQLACIDLPTDPKNPDKKPIAIVQGAVVVAHDDGGIHVYRLSSLMQSARLAGVEERDAAHLTTVGSEEQHTATTSEAAAAASAPSLVVKAEPFAVWSLPARVNELYANRFFVPRKKRDGDGSRRRTHSNYLLVAALVQDKTLRLTTMKLHWDSGTVAKLNGRDKCDTRDNDNGERRHPAELVDACVFTGKDCRIPFSLMKSSMRLVQLFGVEDVTPSATDVLWKKVRRLHCEGNARGAMPVAGLVLVVYDVMGNQSYMLSARVFSTAIRTDGENPLNSIRRPTAPTTPADVAVDAGKKLLKRLALHVLFAPKPSPIVGEGITSISSCHYYCNRPDGVAVNGEGLGTVIPSHWLVGTVEGSLVSVVYGGDGEFHAQSIRPVKNKREAVRFPALHREPISCVAVSRLNDVLTTDIAQKVVVSALPFWDRPPCGSVDGALRHDGGANPQVDLNGFAKCAGDKTMMNATAAGVAAVSAERSGNGVVIRPKYETLLLFPPKHSSYLPFSPWCGTSLTIQSRVVAVLVVPLVAALWLYLLLL